MAGSTYWVIGGEFSSLNFHTMDYSTMSSFGPFKTREEAEEVWKSVSWAMKYKANYRCLIAEEPIKP